MSDREKASSWAREMLSKPTGKALILDTETCDLYDEIIELAIIDTMGNTLYNRRFNPLRPVSRSAQRVHGITLEMLAHEPRFCDEWEVIRAILATAEVVLIYNANFDIGCLGQTIRLHKLARFSFPTECIMHWYAQFYGEWSDWHGSYTWQPLRGGDHSALGDARAALALLGEMATEVAI